MARVSITSNVHQFLSTKIRQGDNVIDATLGNGHDALFLTELIGNEGQLFGFDIQPEAIDSTLKKLASHQLDHRATLIMKSHAYMAKFIPAQFHGRIKCIVFNLGYLPGSDKSTTTLPESTLPALDIALNLLSERGIISILAYSGHPGGEEECDAVKLWVNRLPEEHYETSVINLLPDHNSPPEWILITKVKTLPKSDSEN